MSLSEIEQLIAERVLASVKNDATQSELRERVRAEVLKVDALPKNQADSVVEKILNEFTTEPEDKKSAWQQLTTTARVVLIVMFLLTFVANISNNGFILGLVQTVIGLPIFVIMFGFPSAFVVSLVTRRKENLLNNAIICSGVLLLVSAIGIVLLVVSNV